MKTKEEVIKEAWGRYWNEVKQNVKGMGTIGGWADNDIIHYNEDLGCDSSGFEFYGSLYRPKSLAGIENNNGWVRIESEEDLPKGEMFYTVFTVFENGKQNTAEWWSGDPERIQHWMDRGITHYRPIVEYAPPVY